MVMLRQHDTDALDATSAALRAGVVVAIPTDTVYGLAALPTNGEAVAAIYRVKDRPDGMPLPVLAADLAQVRRLGVDVTDDAAALADRWWPGPLTMVLEFSARADRPPWLAGRGEVAVRVPQHPFLLALLQMTGVLLVTSANRHGAATPATAAAVGDELGQPVGLVIDGGTVNGDPSTLVNLRHGRCAVEREGALSSAAITAALAGAPEGP
jgi:L-threonylcarbamoyladenylate synthase